MSDFDGIDFKASRLATALPQRLGTADTFAPLIAAGFPAVQPGEAFTVAGDITLGMLQGAAQALPAPWVVLAYHAEHLDESPAEGPRQWRCVVLDNVAAMQPHA